MDRLKGYRVTAIVFACCASSALHSTAAASLPPVERWIADSQLASGETAELGANLRKRTMAVDSVGNTYFTGVVRRADGSSAFITQKYDDVGKFVWSAHYLPP